jgi:AsmA-like C-terminal region
VYAAKSADILRLFGVRGNNFEGRPGKLVLTTSGSQVTGFKSVVTADVFGAKVEFDGRYKGAAALPEITGKFNLSSEDGSELGKAIGLPLRANIAGALALSAEIAPLDGGLHVGAITGLLSRQIISGQADVDSAGKMNLDLNFSALDLRDALAISFMPWQGGTSSLDDAFSRGPNFFEGVVWLHPDSLKTGIGQDLKEAVLGLAFDGKGRQFTLAARSADAEPFKLDVTVQPKNSIFVANGTLHLPVELGRVLKLQDGTALAQGTAIFDGAFHGQGRSPMAVLSSLSSDAKYVLRDAVLTRLSPHSFFAALENVKNADDLKLAFESLQKPPGTGLTAQELPLTVQNGTLKFEPLLMTAADADVTVNPSFDFATGDFETRVDIIAKPEKDLPLMQVTYSGGLGQLRQRTDTAAVASKLGYAFMARDLAELERVQKEQEKIATNELAQQKIDETKFAAFQAQRNELRLRLREQKIFAAQRLIDAEKLKSELARSLTEGAAINQLEIAKFLRELEATSP